MKKVFILILLLYSANSLACKFAPTTEPFLINNNLKKIIPKIPTFEISSLSRGVKAKHSCSGAASLRLTQTDKSSEEQGYIFELASGTFNIFRKNGPIKIRPSSPNTDEKNTFVFPYFESTNKPIDSVVKITAVSKSGEKSKPQLLFIKHDGTKIISAPIKLDKKKQCENNRSFFSQLLSCK